jgi:EAL domain-containing protein (putative c-di-GMP-specific phosphodiesterase class I)
MKTIAEGVESQAQLAELKDAGCDGIQGYLISHPLGVDAFAEFMLRLRQAKRKPWPTHSISATHR